MQLRVKVVAHRNTLNRTLMDSNNPHGLNPIMARRRSSGPIAAATSPRGQQLNFESFPDDDGQQERLNSIAQTPDDNGNVICWRRRKRCSNPHCKDPFTGAPHKFKAPEHYLWNCPICGRDRHCRRLVSHPNRGCHHHGGKTPSGWDLPQTKTGDYSKHIQVASLRAEYERLLASEELCSVTDSIALLKARMNEIVAEYGGGASRELLKRMKANRKAYKHQMRRVDPDPAILRQLDRDLDEMVAEGSHAYQVMDDYRGTLRDVIHAIDARDRHVTMERTVITADKAWVLLAHVEETFRVGAEMIVDPINEEYVRRQCELLGADFHSLSRERVQELVQTYLDERHQKKREMLSYASKRFKELAGTGIVPRRRNNA